MSFELIFNTVLNLTNGGFEVQDIISLFKSVAPDLNTSLSSWSQYGTGEKAENNAANEIKTLIQKVNAQSDLKTSIRL